MIIRNHIREGITRELFRCNYHRECLPLDQPSKQLTFLFLQNRTVFNRFVGRAFDLDLPTGKAVQ